ncbi:hypothetical protein TNCV_648591 [Trichonephila clavipes]|uniref:Uncharacterized protein n=1 Tax=Trichonephila clavipes TaxID=2585209 RepID=A0A8X6SK11_TRICX|nr:hypothetical protein TNCV_648591 [Trichonephila clavipes]
MEENLYHSLRPAQIHSTVNTVAVISNFIAVYYRWPSPCKKEQNIISPTEDYVVGAMLHYIFSNPAETFLVEDRLAGLIWPQDLLRLLSAPNSKLSDKFPFIFSDSCASQRFCDYITFLLTPFL